MIKCSTPVQIQCKAVFSTIGCGKRRNQWIALHRPLRVLFHKAYLSAQRGSAGAEDTGKAVLSSRFVLGLLLEIKAKVAGSEGDFDALLAKAQLEEANFCDLMLSQNKAFHVRTPTLGHSASRPPEG